jgi:hypothetical protein
MGNRAVIAFTDATSNSSPCVYLHWNGGLASVQGLLDAAQRMDIEPTAAALHGLAQILIGSSAYLEPYGRADKDNWDNGTYLITRDWRIVKRLYTRGGEERDAEKTAAIADLCAHGIAMLRGVESHAA